MQNDTRTTMTDAPATGATRAELQEIADGLAAVTERVERIYQRVEALTAARAS